MWGRERNFYVACVTNDIGSVRWLIDNGDIDLNNFPNNVSYFTPLATVCLNGHKDLAKVLLDAGADVNYDNNHTSPFEACIITAHTDILHVLFDYGCLISDNFYYRSIVGFLPTKIVRSIYIETASLLSGFLKENSSLLKNLGSDLTVHILSSHFGDRLAPKGNPEKLLTDLIQINSKSKSS